MYQCFVLVFLFVCDINVGHCLTVDRKRMRGKVHILVGLDLVIPHQNSILIYKKVTSIDELNRLYITLKIKFIIN